MKRTVTACIAILMLASTLGAQEFTGSQLAMPMLTDYFKTAEREDRTGGIVLTSIGATLFAAGAAATAWTFTADPADFSAPEELMTYRAVGIGGAATGALLSGIGISLLARPDERYLVKYAFLYAETDPVVQEAWAYAIMKDLADEARRERISGAIMNLCVPLANAGVTVAVSAFDNSWDSLGERLLSSAAWTLPSLIGGIVQLASGSSREERLLETYRTTSAGYRTSGAGLPASQP